MGILEMDFERILGVPLFHSSSHSIMLCGQAALFHCFPEEVFNTSFSIEITIKKTLVTFLPASRFKEIFRTKSY